MAQLDVVAGLPGTASLAPGTALMPVALLSVFVAFCSATKDIAIATKTYRIEVVAVEVQGAMEAT